MQGNAFLGAFFAVSTLLQEFGITQEQYREVVHKQYVKKFGKLGEAVVASNMEVMMQGFSQVKEIKMMHIFRYRNMYPRTIKLIASGTLQVKPLITHQFAFQDALKAFDFAAGMPDDAIKIMVKM